MVSRAELKDKMEEAHAAVERYEEEMNHAQGPEEIRELEHRLIRAKQFIAFGLWMLGEREELNF